MDGFTATRKIRAGDAGPEAVDVPILALTADVMDGVEQRCLEAGMNGYLTKPIQKGPLPAEFEQYLPRAS
jgi:CheY-like chemotaxis protein